MSRATPPRRTRSEGGFTLVEVLVAAMILVVGVLGVMSLLNAAQGSTHHTKVRDGATSLAREVIEAARAVPYPDLTPSTITSQLQAQPGLANTSGGSTWQVQRDNIVYTISATVCSVDGGADKYGDHSGGTFCADSTQTGTDDSDPEDYKRVAVNVSWQGAGQTVTVRQEAVINDPGSAFAPSVIAMTASKALVTDQNDTGSIVFSPVKTSTKAQEVRWYVDNVQRGTASPSGNDWQFTWNTNGVSDGTYLVRAQAYDRYGQTGAGYVVTIVLNRAHPAAPSSVVCGRHPLWGSLVELEWNPNPERDVTGYEVYRQTGGSANIQNDVKVCSTQVGDPNATYCADPNAPSGNQHYYVVALAPAIPPATGVDRSAFTFVDSDPSPANLAPTAPPTVTATALAGGGVQLSWTASVDPEGKPIRYYRIYRDDASSYTKRYDHTDDGTTLSWTDPSSDASTHRYWVTAVDDHMAESPLAPNGGITP